jgi:NitT/TauT family transport system ATP-binding protein
VTNLPHQSADDHTAGLSEAQDAPSLEVDNVSRVFSGKDDGLVALANVTMDVKQGEFISLVGPSGCGKTTLLKIIAGLMTPSAGEVRFESSVITEPRNDIGLMFQTPTLFDWRTAVRNISLPLEIRQSTGFDWDTRIAEVLDLVGLRGFEDHYPRELSGGMQQRVALCRLLVSDPQLMLLDEPFGALDEFTREHLNTELARISEHENKTTVFVTHNIGEAIFLSDRVAVMGVKPGRILEIVDVPIERPRIPSVRTSAEYTTVTNQIRDILGLG